MTDSLHRRSEDQRACRETSRLDGVTSRRSSRGRIALQRTRTHFGSGSYLDHQSHAWACLATTKQPSAALRTADAPPHTSPPVACRKIDVMRPARPALYAITTVLILHVGCGQSGAPEQVPGRQASAPASEPGPAGDLFIDATEGSG